MEGRNSARSPMMPLAHQRIVRGFLIGALWAVAVVSAASPEAEARAAAWLKAWDGQPNHRTATAGDEAGAAWLAREVEAIHGPVVSETFRIDRIDTTAAYVENRRARANRGRAVFRRSSTGRDGVRATAGEHGRVDCRAAAGTIGGLRAGLQPGAAGEQASRAGDRDTGRFARTRAVECGELSRAVWAADLAGVEYRARPAPRCGRAQGGAARRRAVHAHAG